MKASQPQSATEPANTGRADDSETTSTTATDEHTTPKLAYSVPEVAKMLGISRASAYTYVRTGAIASISLGGRIIVPKRAIDQLLAIDL